MKIKICGIQNESASEKVCQLKPDFIGIVFHPFSKRYVSDLNIAKHISHHAKKYQVQTVGVFVHHSHQEIENICAQTDINIAQLHADKSKHQHALLSQHISRIYVIPVEPSGFFAVDFSDLQHLNSERDYILFDHQNPGRGKLFDHFSFSQSLKKYLSVYKNFRCFLAGGLTPDNIEPIIHENHLQQFYGLDVSSGVETTSGKKCTKKIKQFMRRGQTL